MAEVVPIVDSERMREMVARERSKSLMLRAWILSGLFFMALPGTLLGFSNLMAISAHHGVGALPPAWMEGHGHAQVFGWIGSFILGIGFYSQPARGRSVLRLPVWCFSLWTSGVLLRWIANVYGWHWRELFMLSATFEVIAVGLFLAAASRHKRTEGSDRGGKRARMELWMTSVLLGTLGMTASVLFNAVECVRLAWAGVSPSFPHSVDQRYLVVLGWGFVVPVVWGFSARWLPTFLALRTLRNRALLAALCLDVLGVALGLAGVFQVATIVLFSSAVTAIAALRVAEKPRGAAKLIGVHRSFPLFVRIAYGWMAVGSAMGVWAAFADRNGGIWGASRHALTVGFFATMVFAIGPRILPHFCGVVRLFSTRLMLLALLFLQMGCVLRVTSEPLAYEGFANFAWRVLPFSGALELCGVLIFAANIALTLLFGRSMLELAQAGNRNAA